MSYLRFTEQCDPSSAVLRPLSPATGGGWGVQYHAIGGIEEMAFRSFDDAQAFAADVKRCGPDEAKRRYVARRHDT